MIAASLPIYVSLWALTAAILITNYNLYKVMKRGWKTVEELDAVKFEVDIERMKRGEDPIFYKPTDEAWSEWWVLMGDDPDRPLDGPFTDVAEAMEFARQHYELGDARLIKLHSNGDRTIVASTNPEDLNRE